MGKNLILQPEWLDPAKAFQFPDWKKIHAWVGERLPETEWHEVYTQLARDWLGRIARKLPAKIVVAESANFIVVVRKWRKTPNSAWGSWKAMRPRFVRHWRD